MVLSDDIYEHIRYTDGAFINIVNACPDLYDRSIVLNGVSKAYSMTGWRIGYAAGPDWLIKAMKKIQSQSTSNPTSISQVAAEAALRGDQSCIGNMLKAFKERHDFVLSSLNAIDGVRCLPADGAFYSFPDFSAAIKALKGVETDVEFSEFLINEAEIAVVPGSAFGAPNYIRLSYATSMENLEKALERLARVLTDL
jgi:aspartate aminotransferase